MMKRTIARGDVLTESCERKRFLKSSANASSILTDHLSLFTYLSCRSPMKDEGRSPELSAVSSVVEHYLDTVGVRGSKPLPRTIFRVITSKAVCSIVISALSLTAVFQEPSAQNSAIARGVKKRITIYAPRPKYERCWPEGTGIF